ncbi:hypothetical protein DEI99_006285 [Curtobacterium sp. MCLR17_036]|uniref:hypothetical protein n=1 Tax=Curtobacterium sp. MCLR17_036 TaxID=2175620 RepID=UPI0011B38EB3|nr:hypothetical protein [Curtobacterium sp. MCLR17_036]WIE66139.1 hypothetical protein DEI99_006285 [Curtobacterium sp. MCLR17_036]
MIGFRRSGIELSRLTRIVEKSGVEWLSLKRERAIALSALTIVLASAGCDATRGGASAAEGASDVENSLGVRRVLVTHREVAQSVGSTTIVVLTATDPEQRRDEVAAFSRALLDAAYLEDEWKPSAGVRVVVKDYDGPPLGQSLERAGWDLVGWDQSVPGTVFVGAPEMEKQFGRWPAALS